MGAAKSAGSWSVDVCWKAICTLSVVAIVALVLLTLKSSQLKKSDIFRQKLCGDVVSYQSFHLLSVRDVSNL